MRRSGIRAVFVLGVPALASTVMFVAHERHPIILLLLSVFLWPLFVIDMLSCWRNTRVALERKGESVCDFERSFSKLAVDATVVMAVYEALAVWFPVRKGDRFDKHLWMDLDDIVSVCARAAKRCNKKLVDGWALEVRARVESVEDLVIYLSGLSSALPDD